MRRFTALAALALLLPACSTSRIYSAGEDAPRVAAAPPALAEPPHLLFAGFRLPPEGDPTPPAMVYLHSRDGFRWTPIAGGRPILAPPLGLRDPSIARGPDGTYHAVWTTRSRHSIGYASSRDLLHWSEPALLPVMRSIPGVENCWAPELLWLEDQHAWLIHYASTVHGSRDPATAGGETLNHRLYATTTTDFARFTTPTILYDPGHTVIDATIFPTGSPDPAHAWAMAVKDERLEPLAKSIHLVFAPTPTGPWSDPTAPISPAWREGPAILQLAGLWWMYLDKYRSNRYVLLQSRDLATWFEPLLDPTFPEGFRHGCVLRIPPELARTLLDEPAHPHAPGPGRNNTRELRNGVISPF